MTWTDEELTTLAEQPLQITGAGMDSLIADLRTARAALRTVAMLAKTESARPGHAGSCTSAFEEIKRLALRVLS